MHFLGLLPMIDPPRFDTAVTVRRLMDAGVEVTLGRALKRYRRQSSHPSPRNHLGAPAHTLLKRGR